MGPKFALGEVEGQPCPHLLLGEMCERGVGRGENHERAAHFYYLAAELGNPKGQHYLGKVTRRRATAFSLFGCT